MGTVATGCRLESSLAPADTSSAPLVLGRTTAVERRRPIAVPAAAAAAVGRERALRFGLSFIDPQRPAGQLFTIECFDRFRGIVFALELDEGKPAHATGHPVEGHHHVLDRTDGPERLEQLLARNVETQITSKHFA